MRGAQFTGRTPGRTAGTIAGHVRTQRAVAGSRLRASGRKAAGSNGLSLRTRLLLVQIAVTAVFLLIMGIVSTALFAQHLRSQFHATILAESTRSPADINQRPAPGVAAVEVTFGPFAVQPLSSRTSATSLITDALARAIRRMGPMEVARLGRTERWFPVGPAGPLDLQAAARLIPTENLARRPSVLIVAEQATTLTEQLRGLILKEMITGGGLIAPLGLGRAGVARPGRRPRSPADCDAPHAHR